MEAIKRTAEVSFFKPNYKDKRAIEPIMDELVEYINTKVLEDFYEKLDKSEQNDYYWPSSGKFNWTLEDAQKMYETLHMMGFESIKEFVEPSKEHLEIRPSARIKLEKQSAAQCGDTCCDTCCD